MGKKFLSADQQEEAGILTPEVKARLAQAYSALEGGTSGAPAHEAPPAGQTALFTTYEDAQECYRCGGRMVRTGSCYTCRDCGRAVVEARTIKSINDLTSHMMWVVPFEFSAAKGVDLDRIGKDLRVPREDPWVKVGTTTIDGDAQTIAGLFGLSVEGLSTTIAYLIKDRIVVHVGGRTIMPVSAEFTKNCDGFVSCDIVRRQSEIDAEKAAALVEWNRELARRAIEPMLHRATPICPECGPHGNNGHVLGLEEWYPCTTCGEVTEPPSSLGVDEWLSDEPEGGYHQVSWNVPPTGFTVPSKAEVENYIRHCAVQGKFTM
jgi:hypothetical protein